MTWFEEYERLEVTQKDEFSRIANKMLNHTFVLKDKLDIANKKLIPNKDFRFIVNNRTIFKNYFDMIQWELKVNELQGYCSIYHNSGSNRKQFDRVTTYILYILRLIYEEERESLTLQRRFVSTTIGDIQQKLVHLELVKDRLKEYQWIDILKVLRQYQLIERETDQLNAETVVFIYPSIQDVLTFDSLKKLLTVLNESSERNTLDNEEIEE